MLEKVCTQLTRPIPLNHKVTASHERKIIPMDTSQFRYLRFRAIGNMEVAGQNGNSDGFPYEWFEDERPGFGYKSFRNKRAHFEHNSSEGVKGSIGDLPDAYLNKFIYPGEIVSSLNIKTSSAPRWADLTTPDLTDARLKILAYPSQKGGDIEVLMRIDTKLVESAQVKPEVRKALARMIRMIDTGQVLTCSMGTNVGYSGCTACGNIARFSSDYCDHLKPQRKGLITLVAANQIRDMLDKNQLRVEWLPHLLASKNDINEVVKGSSNRGIPIRNAEMNHEVSFFELSVVGTPAYTAAVQLEKYAAQSRGDYQEYLKKARAFLGDDAILDLYGLMQQEGIISSMCEVR
jgi:hypothetical protein